MVVSVTTFVICGLFLLLAIPVGEVPAEPPRPTPSVGTGADPTAAVPGAMPEEPAVAPGPAAPRRRSVVYSRAFRPQAHGAESVTGTAARAPLRVPYERDGTVRFVPASAIAAVRADGHYSWLITGDGELFCPWPISRLADAVADTGFIRTHRSYLANLDQVTGFRRDGDRGVCLLGEGEGVEVPVSRNRIAEVRAALGVRAH
jgi:hypothetical protein